MVIVKNPKNIAYWFHEKVGNISHGVTISEYPLRNVKCVKMVSEKKPDGKYITKLYYNDKIVTVEDDGTCKSGYEYTVNIQKHIHKLLGVPFPSKKYENFARKYMKKNKKEGLCK